MSHNIYSVNGITQDVDSYISTGPEYIQIGRGEADPSPNLSLSINSAWPFYDTDPIVRINGASLTKSGNKITEVTLPAGTYIFWLQCSATGITSITKGRWILVYPDTLINTVNGSDWGVNPLPIAQYQYIKIASTKTFYVKCIQALPSSTTSTNDRYTRCSSMTILKVS